MTPLRPDRILHPWRSVRALARRSWRKAQSILQARQDKALLRITRTSCWCGGAIRPVLWSSAFGTCADCGSFVNRRPPDPSCIHSLYGIDSYWRRRQAIHGYPTIEDRASLYRQDGRLETWLRLVERYAPKPCRAIEIGCAPGVLLSELALRGYECIGVEVDVSTARWLQQATRLNIKAGVFPGVEVPRCGLFLAMDVIEHSYSPEEFLAAAAALLDPGGVAILQTVIDRYGGERPFIERPDVFDDIEHLFVFSEAAMVRLGHAAGLEVVDSTQRAFLAGEICVYRKPAAPADRGCAPR